jgi:surface antigen
MRRIVMVIACAILGVASGANAQPLLDRGTRVRVSIGGGLPETGGRPQATQSLSGLVASMDTAAIVVALGSGMERHVPLQSLLRIEVSAGHGSRRTAGTIVGGLVSGALFVGAACGFSDGSCGVSSSNVGGFLAYYAVGALPGVFIGRAIGARMQGEERWRELWRR